MTHGLGSGVWLYMQNLAYLFILVDRGSATIVRFYLKKLKKHSEQGTSSRLN